MVGMIEETDIDIHWTTANEMCQSMLRLQAKGARSHMLRKNCSLIGFWTLLHLPLVR